MKPLRFLLPLLGAIFFVPLHAAPTATATLTADQTYLLPTAGTVTFTAALAGYPGATSSIGWSVVLPAGWAYVSGAGEPDIRPAAGQTGSLEWAYISIPSSATFTFTVSYPAGLNASAAITSGVIVRYSGTRDNVTPSTVNLSPAPAPIVGNSGTINATYASTLALTIDATSPIPVTGYAATGLPTGLTLDGATGRISGAPTQTGTFPVTLSATNAAGTGSANVSLVVGPANASIALGALSATYDGQPHAATATTTPANLAVALLYGSPGSATPPTDAGTYPVSASITAAGYTASASGSLVIAAATQSIAFAPVGVVQPGFSYTLAATASSSLPVTFAVVSGPATVSGATLSVDGTGAIVVRASQAGSKNYLAATADQTVSAGKLAQTITFAPPSDHLATDAPFTLAATASSGLSVTFTLVSGPAFLSGASITLTGAPGTVIVRASQAGDATYDAATDVTRTFAVTADTDRVFFGGLQSGATAAKDPSVLRALSAAVVGDVAAVLPARSSRGTLMIVAPAAGLDVVIAFTLQEDGSFVTTTTQTVSGTARSVTVRGQLAGNVLSGSIDDLGFRFSTSVDLGGPSSASAGFYQSTGLATASATTYTIVGTHNDVLVLVVTPALTVGGLATLTTAGTFQLDLPAAGTTPAITLKGVVDTAATTVSGTLLVASQTTIDLAGLKNTTTRTDRLINLSSRAHVGAGEQLLITGLVIGGSVPKPVLIRAVGPGLAALGVKNFLANPKIRIEQAGVLVAENDDWSQSADPAALATGAARLGAFPLDAGSRDAAFLATLAPGVYTVQVTAGGNSVQDGVALAEIYDAAENPSADYQRLLNISSRGQVSVGEDLLIGGFVVTGNHPKKVLIRGVGPALAAQGVAHPLADPQLKLYQGSAVLARNDNWSDDATAAAEIAAAARVTGAFALTAGSKDAALVVNLAPGLYSAQVVSDDGTAGIALVEIYEIPE